MTDAIDDDLIEVDPDGELIEVLSDSAASEQLANIHRSLKDLPDIPASINPVNVVLCYDMCGIDDHSISEAMSIPLHTVRSIRSSDIYSSMKTMVIEGLIKNARSTVQGVLTTHARAAAVQLVDDAQNAGRATDRISAAKEILDRSGNSAKAIIEHRHALNTELRINFVKQERAFEGITIDVTDTDEDTPALPNH